MSNYEVGDTVEYKSEVSTAFDTIPDPKLTTESWVFVSKNFTDSSKIYTAKHFGYFVLVDDTTYFNETIEWQVTNEPIYGNNNNLLQLNLYKNTELIYSGYVTYDTINGLKQLNVLRDLTPAYFLYEARDNLGIVNYESKVPVTDTYAELVYANLANYGKHGVWEPIKIKDPPSKSEINFVIYNPDNKVISIPTFYGSFSFRLFDAIGREVLKTYANSVYVPNLPNGIYFYHLSAVVEVVLDNQNASGKILIR